MSRPRKCRGLILAIAVMALVALLGAAALTIDIGRLVLAKQCLQDATDAAALAGVCATVNNGMDTEAGTQAAIETASANEVLGIPLILDPQEDVQVGAWDEETQQIVPWSPAFTSMAVQVTGRLTEDSPNGPIPLLFGGVLSNLHVEMTASAAASMGVTTMPRKALDLIIIQDASGSFVEEWQDAMDANIGLVNLINGVAQGDQVGFVAFNEGIKTKGTWEGSLWGGQWVYTPYDLELTALEQGSDLPQDVQDTFDIACSDTPSSYTNPGIALDWAIDDFASHASEGSNKMIVLVSDGMPFGSSDSKTQEYRDYALEQADRAEAAGIRIHTVTLTAEEYDDYGYGGSDFEFNESLTRNGGYAFRTHDPQKLRAILISVGSIEIGKSRLFQ